MFGIIETIRIEDDITSVHAYAGTSAAWVMAW